MLSTLVLLSTVFVRCVFSESYHAVTYVNTINDWSSPAAIANGIGVPGYGNENGYNVINLGFWLSAGPADMAVLWAEPKAYFGDDFMIEVCGSNDVSAFQQTLKAKYNDAGKKIMISAYGATGHPTSEGHDAVTEAENLAAFVVTNHFDGVDVDWEDMTAMNGGYAEVWLIEFQRKLRELLPSPQYTITHAPQGPYFMGSDILESGVPKYPNGSYLKVHQEVGHLIDWYNMQYYNQGTTQYDTFQELFISASGWAPNTAVQELMDGSNNMGVSVPASQIVIGKPATLADAYNTGYVEPQAMAAIFQQALDDQNLGWNTGFMTWELRSDINNDFQFSELMNAVFHGESLPPTEQSTPAPTQSPDNTPAPTQSPTSAPTVEPLNCPDEEWHVCAEGIDCCPTGFATIAQITVGQGSDAKTAWLCGESRRRFSQVFEAESLPFAKN